MALTLIVQPIGWRWSTWSKAGGSWGEKRSAPITGLGGVRIKRRARKLCLRVCTTIRLPCSTASTGAFFFSCRRSLRASLIENCWGSAGEADALGVADQRVEVAPHALDRRQHVQ